MRREIIATYRLQLRGPASEPSGRAFGFAQAKAQLPYLKALGISHLYLSPIFTADPTSTHNYDVTDPTEINPELGGIEGLRELAAAARAEGMGLIIDIVPNHLGIQTPHLNPWWWDVLKQGQDSAYQGYFDIDFHEDNGAGGKIGLPVLGQPGDETALEITTLPGSEETVLAYHDNYFPIAPGTLTSDDPQAVYSQQHYRLMFWRDGVISYRRFFSVNGLAGVRQEDPVVFEHTHRIIRQLIAEDLIDGVRVDHPDGLADPFGYLGRLREVVGPERWLIVEKILEVDEVLDPRLAVDGTTGYDALRELDGVFVSREAEDTLSMLALEQTGSTWDERALAATAQQLKREVAQVELGAEIRRLARAMRRDNFSTAGSGVREEDLYTTIIELVAAMPVYRADYASLSRVTATVVAEMSKRFPSRRDALDLIVAALNVDGEAKVRFAQVCGAVMAKGVEDTTFYRAARLVALQEVGGAPGRFGVSAAEFHLLAQERARLWPRAMTTLATHDTKRGEDVRARIIALTERPTDFVEFCHRISALLPAPDLATGHFLLQNLLGMWPSEDITESHKERFSEYALKSVREAGVHTTWFDPVESFENAILDWVEALFNGPATSLITEFVRTLEPGATAISLGRKLLQLTGPGIPDIYQGTEFFDDSLVDPDNRRFVDYTGRAQVLELLSVEEAATHPDYAKMLVVREGIKVRRTHPEYFVGADVQAVFAEGPAESHLIGLARCRAGLDFGVITLATRRPLILSDRGGWAETTVTLPAGTWTDQLTGQTWEGTVAVAAVFNTFPTALLVRRG